MTKDYAKRYKKTPKKRKPSPLASRARFVFISIVIVLVIVAGILSYFFDHQTSFSRHSTPLLPAKAHSTKERIPPVPTLDAKEEPIDYEFYTLLPKMSIPVPKENTAPPDEQPGFWLQLMVYYNMRDASAFVDRLQLSGLDPVITQRRSTKTDHDLFVVVLGPFSSKENALARQHDLKRMSINSYVFHVDPKVISAEQSETERAVAPVSDATAVR